MQQPEDFGFDSVCCSIGTGGTFTGLIQASLPKQQVLGFNALKNPSVKNFILSQTKKTNWVINPDYTFGISIAVITVLLAAYGVYKGFFDNENLTDPWDDHDD